MNAGVLETMKNLKPINFNIVTILNNNCLRTFERVPPGGVDRRASSTALTQRTPALRSSVARYDRVLLG